MSPADKPKAYREAVYRDRLRSRPRCPLRSRTVKSYRQATCPPGCNLLRCTEKSTGKVFQVDRDSTEAAYGMRNQMLTVKSTKSITILLKPSITRYHEVNRMVTDADFQSRLQSQAATGSQCHFSMTTDCIKYSTEHAKALHEGSRERRHAWTWQV